MNPAAVLAVIVKAQGVMATNAQLNSVQKTLEKTETATTRLGSSMQKTGKKMSSVGRTLTRDVTAPILGIGVAAGVMSAKYHRSMNLIATDAGGSQKEVRGLSKEVLKLAEHSEFGPQKLADSLFFIESAGKRGKTAIADLDKIQKAAMAGNADLEHATFGTVGAMNALGSEGKNVNKILAIMNATVGHGHMRLEELVGALSTGLVGTGKTFGLTFEGMSSAVAFFTRMSEPAQQAATRLRQTITHLASSSTNKGKEALESIGLSAAHMGIEIHKTGRLGPVIAELAKHLQGIGLAKKNQILTEAFGGGRFGTQIREAISNVHLLFKTEKEIAKTATVKRLQHSEKIQAESDAVKLKVLWSTVQAQLIKLGDAILPVVVPIFTKLVGVLDKASHWFTHLSHSGKTTVVIIALIVAAIGPLLVILGTLIRNGGYVVKFIATLIGWFSKTVPAAEEVTVATDAVTASLGAQAETAQAAVVANQELAASLEEVATAQKVAQTGQMSMVIPEAAGVGGQMSLLAQPVTQEATIATEAAGAGAATGFASGLARMLPFAIAAAGVLNIISSVMSGDGKGVLFKTGGLLAGAIVGGLVGGLPGAMIGAGLGTFGGQLIESLFGSAGVEKQTINYFQRAKQALDSLGASGKHINELHKRQKRIVDEVKNSESNLSDVRRKFGPNSEQALTAEAELIHKRRTLKKLNREIKEQEAERRGPAKKATEIGLRHDVPKIAAQQARILASRNEQRWQLGNVVANYKAGLAGYDLVRKKQNELTKTNEKLQRKTRQLGETFKDAGQKISPKFAHELEKVAAKSRELSQAKNPIARWFDVKIKAPNISAVVAQQLAKTKDLTKGNVKDLVKIINQFPKGTRGAIKNTIVQMLNEWAAGHPKLERGVHNLAKTLNSQFAWTKQENGSKRARQAYEKTQGAVGLFQKEVHTKMQAAGQDVTSFTQAGSKGLGGFAGQLNSFASQLGIANAHFTIGKAKEKGPGKQLGGMVVPGGGTGDKVALTAMVEPGEIVHVLNSRASKDRAKLAGLEQINHEVPRFPHRFAEGGAMGGSGTAAAMAEAQAINAKEYPYVWGGGHSGFSGPYDCSGAVSAVLHAAGYLGKPMTSGTLANFGAPGPGPITIYANGVHAFMSIMGRFFGTSESNPGGGAGFFPASIGLGEARSGDSGGAFQVRHPVGEGAGMLQVAKELFEGPAGKLQKTGQESMNLAQKMSSKWLAKNMPGEFGGGNPNLEGIGGPVASEAAEVVKRGHAPHVAALALFEALWAESSMGAASPGNVLQALEPYTKIRPAPQEMSGFLYGVPTWTGTSAVSLANSGLPANAIAQLVQSSGVGEGNEGRANYAPQRARAEATMSQFGLDAGGALAAASKGKTKKVDPIAKSVKNVLHGLGAGKHLPKYQGALKKLGRHIDAIGLNEKELNRLKHLQDMTNEVTKYQEFAENASTLTHSVENPIGSGKEEVIQGVFKNRNEGGWLNEQLATLLNLRQHVVGEFGIDSPQLPKVKHLLKEANNRLHGIQKAIREAEQKKREIEKKVKEVEQAAKQSKTKLEGEITEKEHALSTEEHKKKPNKAVLETLRSEIHTRKDGISNTDKESQKEVKKLKADITAIEKAQKARHREEDGLTGTIIPKLGAKELSVAQLLEGIKGESGEIEGKGQHIVFSGLQAIQGAGANMEDIGNPPALGSVGGEIFMVQNRLREIQEEAERASVTTSTGETADEQEARQIAEEIGMEWKKKYMVLETQARVLQEMPSVQAIATSPFAGAFAKGGVMMAEVGEKGREIIAAPQGSRVIPSHEAQAALAKSTGSGPINFEHVEFHEATGKVKGRVNGEPFEQETKKVTRKQSRSAMARTPGGKGLR